MIFIRRSHWHRGLLTLVCIGLLASCNDKNSLQPGIPMVTAPNVVGMTQAAATSTLEGVGLVLGTVTPIGSVTVPVGAVISQSVAPGVILTPGTSVNITVSSGPTTVPNVVGLTQSAAAAALTGAGLTLGVVTTAGSTTVPAGSVISQSPVATTQVVSGSAVSVTVSAGLPARYAYVANIGSLSAYSIGSAGQLAPLSGSPVPIPGSGQLYESKIDPTGQFLYVVNYGVPGGLYAFSIVQSDGSLVALNGGLPYSAGTLPRSLTFDATGSFLYVLSSNDSSISAFSLDQSTGELSALATYPITEANPSPQPRQLVRAGNYLYVAEYGANSIEVFVIAPGTGTLTQGVAGSPFATDTQPYSLAVDPSGSVLYSANTGPDGAGSISPFTINSSTGVLTPASVLPLAIPAYNQISIDPQGKFLFVTEIDGVSVYPISTSNGTLGAPVAGPPFTTGSFPYSVSVDITGEFAYVANAGQADVSEFTLDSSTGVLTPIQGSPVAAGDNPTSVAIL